MPASSPPPSGADPITDPSTPQPRSPQNFAGWNHTHDRNADGNDYVSRIVLSGDDAMKTEEGCDHNKDMSASGHRDLNNEANDGDHVDGTRFHDDDHAAVSGGRGNNQTAYNTKNNAISSGPNDGDAGDNDSNKDDCNSDEAKYSGVIDTKHGIDNKSFVHDCEVSTSSVINHNHNYTARKLVNDDHHTCSSGKNASHFNANVDVLDVFAGDDTTVDVLNYVNLANTQAVISNTNALNSKNNKNTHNENNENTPVSNISRENVKISRPDEVSGPGCGLQNSACNQQPALCNQMVGAVAGSLIHFGLGAVVGLSGVILPALMDPLSDDLVLNPHQATLFSSLMSIGALVGSIVSGPLMVFWGQRVTLLVALPVAALGWLIMAFTPSVWLLQTARVLLGFITGIYGGPSANYVTEISHTSVRGRLTGTVDLFRQFGFLFVYVIGSSGLSWRNTSMVCGGVTTVIPFLALLFLPNSPRWLATRSRLSEARQSLKFYRGPEYAVDEELQDIKQQLQKANKQLSTKEQLMVCKKPQVMKIFIVLIFMFFMYQFSGNYSMVVFSVTIFQSAQSTIGEYTSTIVVGVVRVFGVLAYISLADKIGRKTLLISSSIVGSLAMGVMGLYFYLGALEVDVTAIQWLPLASMTVFIFFTCITEPALVLLRAELLPTSIRSVGVPIIYVFFFSGAFLVSYLYPLMVERIGSHGTFWTYAVDGLIIALVGAIFIPETLSKSLEDIEKAYEKKKEGKELSIFNKAHT